MFYGRGVKAFPEVEWLDRGIKNRGGLAVWGMATYTSEGLKVVRPW